MCPPLSLKMAHKSRHPLQECHPIDYEERVRHTHIALLCYTRKRSMYRCFRKRKRERRARCCVCVREKCSRDTGKERYKSRSNISTEFHNHSFEAASVWADSQSCTVEVDRLWRQVLLSSFLFLNGNPRQPPTHHFIPDLALDLYLSQL